MIDQVDAAFDRRKLIAAIAAGTAAALMPSGESRAQDVPEPNEAAVLRDPEVAVAGNADGDIAIVEWFDYNCPYCRKLQPDLQQIVHDDGKVRWLLKEWPILGPESVTASRMALACKYQDKYFQAHDALFGANSRLTDARIDEILAGAGVDVERAKRDLTTNAKAINALLVRNDQQARGLSFRGTPSFIVGKFRVPGVLTVAQFEQVIADARKAKAQ
jgi:protein-disulfide isomerase